MGRKKKNKSAITAVARKAGKSQSNSRSTKRKASTKKKSSSTTPLAVLNADKLKELYCTMVKCRMLAERMDGAQNSKRPTGRAIYGLEAMLVGAGTHLLAQDCVALEHSGWIASLIKGTPLRVILACLREVQGKNGAGRSASPSGKVAAATKLSMATGLALAREMKGKGAITLIVCTQNPGTLAFDPDAMALAATETLPLVCLLEGRYDTPSESLPPAAAAGTDAAYYPRIAVDGCDVVAVFRVAQEAIRRAREGHGPAVIECLTSRTNGTAENAGREDAGNSAMARSAAPLSFMEQYLRRRDLWSDEWSRALAAAFTGELNDAAASVDQPTGLDLPFDNVYSADGWQAPRAEKASRQQTTMPAAP